MNNDNVNIKLFIACFLRWDKTGEYVSPSDLLLEHHRKQRKSRTDSIKKTLFNYNKQFKQKERKSPQFYKNYNKKFKVIANTNFCKSCGEQLSISRKIPYCSGCLRHIKEYENSILSKFIACCKKYSRHKPILHMRKEGKTYREIGKYYELSYQRIQQIVKAYS